MARCGKVNFNDLIKFQKQVEESLNEEQIDLFIEKCAKKIARSIYGKAVQRTPVGVYPESSGKEGGTLRRGWTIGKIEKSDGTYKIEIINPVEYASFVEHGHRTANHKGFVEGRHMLELSVSEVEKAAPKVLENMLKKKLKECMK